MSTVRIIINFDDDTTIDLEEEIKADGNPIYKKRTTLEAIGRLTPRISGAVTGLYGDIDAR